jgi:hypothetical protein
MRVRPTGDGRLMLVAEGDGDVTELLRLVLALWATRKEVGKPEQEDVWVGQ